MTRTTNARIAGATFLLYIVVGVTQMVVGRGTKSGADMAARLASVAQHAPQLRLELVLDLLVSVIALTLAVSLWAITRDEDEDLAVLALACRAIEGMTPIFAMLATLGLLSLATADASPDASAVAARHALAATLLDVTRWLPVIGASFFSVGSTIFAWLLLRGRLVPVPLAWLGVASSLLLVAGLTLQLADLLHAPFTQLMWIPMAAFEVPLGVWLIVRGVRGAGARARA